MAISAGKHVYCEWPLGNGLAVSLELPRLPQQHGVLGVIGMQAYVALAVRYLQQLIRDGFVGDVLSTTVAGYGA